MNCIIIKAQSMYKISTDYLKYDRNVIICTLVGRPPFHDRTKYVILVGVYANCEISIDLLYMGLNYYKKVQCTAHLSQGCSVVYIAYPACQLQSTVLRAPQCMVLLQGQPCGNVHSMCQPVRGDWDKHCHKHMRLYNMKAP